ncbi:MAG: hypothetical protein ACOYLE_10815 [Bacteroidales bacterium]
MKLIAKRILKIFFILLISILYLIGIYLLFLTITDYKPQKIENIAVIGSIENNQLLYDDLTFISWDIGFAGSGKENNFFQEVSKKHKPGIDIFQKKFNGILNTLSTYSYIDFILLQEVDVFSNRSFYTNQKKFVSDFLPDYNYTFAINYDIKYSAFPIYAPLGRVKSGIQILGKFKPVIVQKHTYTPNFTWPDRILKPDPCYLTNHYSLMNGKQLVLVNIQNTYSENSVQNRNELKEIRAFVCNEFEKGNYVIVGGNWNINPPAYKKQIALKRNKNLFAENEIPFNFMPIDWKWMFDSEIPTQGNLKMINHKAINYSTVMDFFLISPNIEDLSIRNIDLNFEFSNHNPVLMNVKLK